MKKLISRIKKSPFAALMAVAILSSACIAEKTSFEDGMIDEAKMKSTTRSSINFIRDNPTSTDWRLRFKGYGWIVGDEQHLPNEQSKKIFENADTYIKRDDYRIGVYYNFEEHGQYAVIIKKNHRSEVLLNTTGFDLLPSEVIE